MNKISKKHNITHATYTIEYLNDYVYKTVNTRAGPRYCLFRYRYNFDISDPKYRRYRYTLLQRLFVSSCDVSLHWTQHWLIEIWWDALISRCTDVSYLDSVRGQCYFLTPFRTSRDVTRCQTRYSILIILLFGFKLMLRSRGSDKMSKNYRYIGTGSIRFSQWLPYFYIWFRRYFPPETSFALLVAIYILSTLSRPFPKQFGHRFCLRNMTSALENRSLITNQWMFIYPTWRLHSCISDSRCQA